MTETLPSIIEGLCVQLEAMGAGESGVVQWARAKAREAASAAPGPSSAPADPSLESLVRAYLTSRSFPERVLAQLDLEERFGTRPAAEIAETRRVWRKHQADIAAAPKAKGG